jgi:hypothetical protein
MKLTTYERLCSYCAMFLSLAMCTLRCLPSWPTNGMRVATSVSKDVFGVMIGCNVLDLQPCRRGKTLLARRLQGNTLYHQRRGNRTPTPAADQEHAHGLYVKVVHSPPLTQPNPLSCQLMRCAQSPVGIRYSMMLHGIPTCG